MTAITIAIMNMDAKETVAIIDEKQHGYCDRLIIA